ncbi:MAG: hypothetical protein ACYTFG_20490, partial [Planctomycetota bacterium]
MDTEKLLPEDRRFLEIAADRGLVSREIADEIREKLAEMASREEFPGAESLLVKDGLIDSAMAQEIRIEIHGDAPDGEGDPGEEPPSGEEIPEAPAASSHDGSPEAQPAEAVEEIPEAPAVSNHDGPLEAPPA